MERACRNSSRKDKPLTRRDLDHIIVLDKYKTLFCFVPKVACSQWKRVFLMMTGNFSDPSVLDLYSVHFTYRKHLKYLHEYSSQQITDRVNRYKKFVVVRNPMDRLLSAFRNKFHGTGFKDQTYRDIAVDIIRGYRPKYTKPIAGDDVTFLEFLKYVTDDVIPRRDEHWRPSVDLCSPCQINYDFIGTYETLNEDAPFILKQMGTDIKFPEKPKAYGHVKTVQYFPFYFSQIPLYYIGKIWEKFKDDYIFFSYSFLKDIRSIPYLV